MKAFDLDGTIMISPFKTWWLKDLFMYPNRKFFKKYDIEKWEVDLVITARFNSEFRKMVTLFWMQVWGFNATIYFRDFEEYSMERIIEYKADIIEKRRVRTFYTDDRLEYEGLRRLLPYKQIIYIHDRY